MRATVRKWGNSLALRIPSGLAEDAHLHEGAEVEVAVDGGRLVVVPVVTAEPSLDVLIAGITPDNVHHERWGGDSRGVEVW